MAMGDVITIRGGTTIEVVNTDAEGRLVMADGLVLAREDGHDAIIDIATLTGACMRALGHRGRRRVRQRPGPGRPDQDGGRADRRAGVAAAALQGLSQAARLARRRHEEPGLRRGRRDHRRALPRRSSSRACRGRTSTLPALPRARTAGPGTRPAAPDLALGCWSSWHSDLAATDGANRRLTAAKRDGGDDDRRSGR